MAIGLALSFGIRLPVNFRSPYQALSIVEFWRRWHITLSRFLRDYLYIPLGGNRLGSRRRYANLILTMLLGGLWHGAGWNFLIWGGLHGIYLSINHLWGSWRYEEKYRSRRNSTLGLLQTRLSWAVTFLAVAVSWVFFRAQTLSGAWKLLSGLFGFGPEGAAYESQGILRLMDLPILVGSSWLLLIGSGMVAVALSVALFLPNVSQIFGYREYRRPADPHVFVQWRPNGAWALFTALALSVSLLGMWQRLEFLYFQF
jgi:D-alanyl-lipoteichoic acid acyltransferase DltB (MBOAT superfamily)